MNRNLMAELNASENPDAPMAKGTRKAPPRLPTRPTAGIVLPTSKLDYPPKTPERSRQTKTAEDVSSFVSPSQRGKDFDWGKTAVKNDPRHNRVRQMLIEQHTGEAAALPVKKLPEDTRVAEPYSPPPEKERASAPRIKKTTNGARSGSGVTTALETTVPETTAATHSATGADATVEASAPARRDTSIPAPALPCTSADDLAAAPYMRLHPSDPELAAMKGGIFQAATAHTEQLANLRTEMDSRFSLTHKAIDRVENRAYAGIAAAMAMPNLTPREPGKVIVAAGGASYLGRSAFAAGATYRSRCGAWLVHAAVAVTSRGDPAFRAHVGYEF
ncbi:YadA-like family protein [Robbsia sp. KACC 23696]|uniref:YadA-like family protein n=1 Tax=Robbsia sp. KACC 23696 TaxID=3149231 RepID=UPI00325A826C